MKRWLAREALLGSAAVLASLGTACKPDQSVKAGAPVLTEMIIVAGSSATRVLPTTGDCAPGSPAGDGGADDGGTDGGGPTGVADGAPCDPAADVLCRKDKNWCSCNGTDPMDPAKGEWSCAPFGPVASVIAIFDRLIDVSDFDPDTNAAPDTASLDLPAGSPTATLSIDYASNGSTTGLIFPLLGNYVIGNYRVDGPSLLMMGDPALPSNTAVTVSLSKTAVRAKDGKTAFTGEGFLQDGTITFTTGAFTADIAPPPEGMDGDGGTLPPAPDMTPATLSFSNVVDSEAIRSHITVTSGGTAVPFTLDPAMGTGVSVNVVPTTNWPANATITITLDATTPDVLNETLGAPGVTAMFMTGAP